MGGRNLTLLVWVSSFFSLVCLSIGFVPVDNYLIDCGSPINTTVDNRVFVADIFASKFLKTPRDIVVGNASNSANGTSNSANGTSNSTSSIFATARILNGTSSYTFQIQKPGRHWIRLYFFPVFDQSFNLSSASFSVATQQFQLLSNFQPHNESIKEYSVNITSGNLVLTFTPSANSFAFLNALEVVSVPDELITDEVKMVSSKKSFSGLWGQALETVWRVNMGGPLVSPLNDTLGRTWRPDTHFLLNKNLAKRRTGTPKYAQGGASPDIAPASVYGTATEMNGEANPTYRFNVTWQFDVEPEFQYLIRFHFCDIVSTTSNQITFNVYINTWDAYRNLDLSSLTINTLATPYYMDFVTSQSNSVQLNISIGPPDSIADVYSNAFLNGLEVMKMNDSRSSLGGLAFVSTSQPGSKAKIGIIVGVVVGVILAVVMAIVVFLICRRRKLARLAHAKAWVPFSMNGGNTQTTGRKYFNGTSTTAADLGYRVPLVALQDATNNFEESGCVGVGGFGKVYKGVLADGTKVAVKRGNPQSQQGLREFMTEIEMLSRFRHRHLVSLIGYCDERNEMILVYEYMENGTLKSHLYGSDFPTLSWKQRVEICIGSARGLHYLHTGSDQAIIHRDVKSANILLDENLMAKVADFGLSKAGPELDQTHVSTAVKGSFGYLDPEYFRRQQLTDKSDVYSFGVVLFEVVCARPVIDPSLPRERVNLAEWAMKWQRSGQLEQIIDPQLVGKVRPDSLRKFGETAEKCLSEFGVDRPTMGDVLWNLEYVLQLQEAVIPGDPDENSMNGIAELSPRVGNVNNIEMAGTDTRLEMSNVDELMGVSMSRVFSEMVKGEGR